MDRTIGLDFGTSTSVLAESSVLGPRVIPLGLSHRWIPSILGRDESGWLVGDDAASLTERQILRSAKRAITEGANELRLPGSDEAIDANFAITSILSNLRRVAADNFVDLTEPGALRLGCPASWDGPKRLRLLTLVHEAGIQVDDSALIDEPIAAGVAWVESQWARDNNVEGKVLVIDIGGGTLDVAVLKVEALQGGTSRPSVTVQSCDGLDEAGDRFDATIAKAIANDLDEAGFAVDADERSEDFGWLLRAAREAKEELTDHEFLHKRVDLPRGSRTIEFSRDRLADEIAPQLDRAMGLVWACLRAALMTELAASRGRRGALDPMAARRIEPDHLARDVDYVLIAGGMAQSPVLIEYFARYFPHDRIHGGVRDVSATELIAAGLANTAEFDRLNLHRPGVTFTLEWPEAREVVYEAYKPMYDQFEVYYRNSTVYRWKPSAALPTRGEAFFTARAVGGEPIEFRIDGEVVPALKFGFGHSVTPVIRIEPSGRIVMTDGRGVQRDFRVQQWPVLRGRHTGAIEIERGEDENNSLANLVWHQLPYD